MSPTLSRACSSSYSPFYTSYSGEPRCYGVEVQGFNYADAGAAAGCPASFCSGSSSTTGRARPICVVFMLTDISTAWWETTERMLRGDVGQIT
ncbi:uncharacterized protein E5676_scaffold156G00570 [Cucumis melo var. makuwa]|uniref:Uncharacterized protein n=1 Tax=Cucumis melo var. makuwa TaxID=1194695 RepID=A0A5A7SU95_CUCMM|nr:uncharacterized protein E6C27_scaffold853G00590 [Cucumis melo var. makuwa]TYJ98750.1 uncharacterized protein E5676_scaffold156G00570 [Cucumis melo var. makuwa]